MGNRAYVPYQNPQWFRLWDPSLPIKQYYAAGMARSYAHRLATANYYRAQWNAKAARLRARAADEVYQSWSNSGNGSDLPIAMVILPGQKAPQTMRLVDHERNRVALAPVQSTGSRSVEIYRFTDFDRESQRAIRKAAKLID